MERGSDKHGPRVDEQLKHELDGMLRGDGPSHAEEWRDPEPPADDDPVLHDPRSPEQAGPPTG